MKTPLLVPLPRFNAAGQHCFRWGGSCWQQARQALWQIRYSLSVLPVRTAIDSHLPRTAMTIRNISDRYEVYFREMMRALRPFPLALAISAMLLRSLLPLGWMPSSDARAPLIICPIMGGMTRAAPGKQDAPHHRNRVCPFTASLAQLSAPGAPTPISLHPAKPIVHDLHARAFLFSTRSYRPQAPRGPPPA